MKASMVAMIVEDQLANLANPDGPIVSVTPRDDGGILVVTADIEYVQTWIVGVRPTRRVCEVAKPGKEKTE